MNVEIPEKAYEDGTAELIRFDGSGSETRRRWSDEYWRKRAVQVVDAAAPAILEACLERVARALFAHRTKGSLGEWEFACREVRAEDYGEARTLLGVDPSDLSVGDGGQDA